MAGCSIVLLQRKNSNRTIANWVPNCHCAHTGHKLCKFGLFMAWLLPYWWQFYTTVSWYSPLDINELLHVQSCSFWSWPHSQVARRWTYSQASETFSALSGAWWLVGLENSPCKTEVLLHLYDFQAKAFSALQGVWCVCWGLWSPLSLHFELCWTKELPILLWIHQCVTDRLHIRFNRIYTWH